jgi:2-dehydropantoate 2-reductase
VIAVVGAGAIGGLIAAELGAAGHDVTLCARRPLDRVVVTRDGAERAVDLPVVTAPDEVGAVPWVVVALKGQDSAAAGPWLARLAGAGTAVVVVQNGVEHRERVGPHARGAALIPAITNTAVERTAPGRLVHRAGDELTVAEAPRAPEFARLFDSTALRVRVEDDFLTASWRKLLSNVAANPLTALTSRRMEVFSEPAVRELALGLLREAADVGRAEGAALADDEPERTLARYDALPPDGGSSMLYDRLAGRPLEVDPLTGAVVRAAHRHGLPAPLNQAVLALLLGLDGG